MLIIGVYHLVMFIFRKKERSFLWFGFFSFFIGLYTLITGERTISIILPGITEQVLIRIEYLLLYEAYILFAMYIASLLPGNAGPVKPRVIAWALPALAPIVLFMPVKILVRLDIILNIIAIITLLFIAYLPVRSVARGRRAIYLLASSIPFVICAAHDMLKDMVFHWPFCAVQAASNRNAVCYTPSHLSYPTGLYGHTAKLKR